MRKTALALAVLAPLATFAPLVHADMSILQAGGVTAVPGVNSVTLNFVNFTVTGFQFSNLSTTAGPFYGTLTSVSVNATLNASELYTYADDLALYVDPLPLNAGGLLQIGGFSDLGAAESHTWANGGNSAPGTTVIDTVTLNTPLTFNGASSATIWLGNGYGDIDASGTWTGSITLTGLSTTPVPEPSSWALMMAGGMGIVGWVARRRKALR